MGEEIKEPKVPLAFSILDRINKAVGRISESRSGLEHRIQSIELIPRETNDAKDKLSAPGSMIEALRRVADKLEFEAEELFKINGEIYDLVG